MPNEKSETNLIEPSLKVLLTKKTKIKFSILIATFNRIDGLKLTIEKIFHLIDRDDVECIICDDGSTDETASYLKKNYPKIQLIEHSKSRGYIASRNELLHLTKAKYAISLDDDAHFESGNILETTENYFKQYPKTGVLAFRVFWGLKLPKNSSTKQKSEQVQSFVGCGHVWNMESWKIIPNYPIWFVIYGEETFAALHLLKKGWEVRYVPEVLVHHRVDLESRKNDVAYENRARKLLSSEWYLFFLFYPIKLLRKKLKEVFYPAMIKIVKGRGNELNLDVFFDVFCNLHKIIKHKDRLTLKEFKQFEKLPEGKWFWEPSNEEK